MDIRDRIKELRRVRAGDLVPNPRNWRTHPKAQQDALRGLLSEIGYADALIVRELEDGRLELIDGHLRAETTPDTIVPVLVTDLMEAEAAKLLATLDPLAAMAEADPAKLDELLRDVQTSSEAVAAMLTELAEDSDILKGNGEVVEDEVPEPPAKPVAKAGDLWLLGEHRLLCGDSTKAEDVQRVMGGEKASCVFTDPPYGVSIARKNRLLNTVQKFGRCLTDIESDDLSPEDLEAQLLPAMVNVREHIMADDCTLFVCSPQGGGLGMMMMMQTAGLRARHVLIWYKNSPTFSMGRLDYDYQHEPILLTWLKRHKRPMQGEHHTSVWKIDKPRASPDHPTMKPVALYANAYLNNSDAGDLVADPYAGSGTAFIAAEQLHRRCFGIEISPAYCDVIVKRWETLTGKKATLEKVAEKKKPKPKPKRRRQPVH